MILTFLGTGTSTGVPQMRCDCETCLSSDPRDKRLRASALLQRRKGGPAVLIDCGPDFRYQMLRCGCPDLECALLTHTHYDHVGGLDDLRPYAHMAPDAHFPLYCRPDVATDLRNRIPYCFTEHPYPGVPQFTIYQLKAMERFTLMLDGEPLEVEVLTIKHGKLDIFGYRIGNMAYITDASEVPAETIENISGIDVLVINALRHEKHPSHINLNQALDVIKLTRPKKAYLTHMSHQMGRHAQASALLPDNVEFAFDGLTVDIPDNKHPQLWQKKLHS